MIDIVRVVSATTQFDVWYQQTEAIYFRRVLQKVWLLLSMITDNKI